MIETTCPHCQMLTSTRNNYCGHCGAALDDNPIILRQPAGLNIAGRNLPATQLKRVGISLAVSMVALLAEVGLVYLNRRVQRMQQETAVMPLQSVRNVSKRGNPPPAVVPEEPRRRTVIVLSERIVEIRRFGRPVQRMIERVAYRSDE